jgi:hypothetical protein
MKIKTMKIQIKSDNTFKNQTYLGLLIHELMIVYERALLLRLENSKNHSHIINQEKNKMIRLKIFHEFNH